MVADDEKFEIKPEYIGQIERLRDAMEAFSVAVAEAVTTVIDSMLQVQRVDGADDDLLLQRWESQFGAHWAELWSTPEGSLYYKGDNAGGSLGPDTAPNRDRFRYLVTSGYFLPDTARYPMKQIWGADEEGMQSGD